MGASGVYGGWRVSEVVLAFEAATFWFKLTCAGRAVAPTVIGRLRYVRSAEQSMQERPVLLRRLAETTGEQAAGRLRMMTAAVMMEVMGL